VAREPGRRPVAVRRGLQGVVRGMWKWVTDAPTGLAGVPAETVAIVDAE
jgi:hypothetical protein